MLVILMLPLVLIGCIRFLRISGMVHASLLKQQIFRFVYENEDELTAIAEGQLAGTNQDKNYGKAEIDGVFDGEQPIVQFYWGGMGIAPSTRTICCIPPRSQRHPKSARSPRTSIRSIPTNSMRRQTTRSSSLPSQRQ